MRRIEFLRRGLGMSQREFGSHVGIDASYICNAEKNGVMYPNHLKRIADKLEIEDGGSSLLDVVAEVRKVG